MPQLSLGDEVEIVFKETMRGISEGRIGDAMVETYKTRWAEGRQMAKGRLMNPIETRTNLSLRCRFAARTSLVQPGFDLV